MPTKVPVVKSMVFPVVMYGCESRTIKKTECWRTDAFKLWSWRRLLRVSWIERKSTLNIYWKDWCWIWHQYFGHLMQRADSLEKTLTLGMKDWGPEEKGQQKARWLDRITDSMDMSLRKLLETVKGREALWAAVHGISKNQTQLSDWGRTHTHTYTTLHDMYISYIYPLIHQWTFRLLPCIGYCE